MKTIFVGIHAKYVHTGLAVLSIGKYCEAFSPCIREYTINDSSAQILSSLYEENADIYAFSTYIWNIETVLYLAKSLKALKPHIQIILGGHEVSYTAKEIMQQNPDIDFILRGEGEEPMYALLSALQKHTALSEVPSLTYRFEKDVLETPLCAPGDFDAYPFPYEEELSAYENKILYYESSRGCPFHCSYCLSGHDNTVRFRSMEKVKKELLFFITKEVPLVKFVDRTFNANPKRANEIFRFLIENRGKTTFHFELAGHLLDADTFSILETAPKGLFQFEIGVQSTNAETLKAIGRKVSFAMLSQPIRRILSLSNIHVHLDLIAGLPHESLESFKKSFDDVLSLRPNVLQLGFLKLLKGSALWNQAEAYGYIFSSRPPYTVMQNPWISFAELSMLSRFEEIFDVYYNGGGFRYALEFLLKAFDSPFIVFETLCTYYKDRALFSRPVSIAERYTILEKAFPDISFSDFIRADMFTNPKVKMEYAPDKAFREKCFAFLKNEENVRKYLPEFQTVLPRELYKKVRFATLFGGVYICIVGTTELIEITKDFER